MIGNLFTAWHWLTSWWDIMLSYGTAGLIVSGLVAVAVFVPGIGLKGRLIVLVAAGLVVSHTASFTVGIKKGADRVKANWDQSLDTEAEHGEKARADSERAVRAEPPASVRGDAWNRDGWKKREGD